MKSQKVKIGDVKINPNNPRIIKDVKFKKLVLSVKDFPEMLEIRPIVVNADMVVLGGNMRLKACKEAGIKEVPIIIADNLTEEQQREFLIKDNVSASLIVTGKLGKSTYLFFQMERSFIVHIKSHVSIRKSNRFWSWRFWH